MQVQPIQSGQTFVTAGGFEGELQLQAWSALTLFFGAEFDLSEWFRWSTAADLTLLN